MKFLIVIGMLVVAAPSLAAEQALENVTKKSEKQSAFKGLFYKVWNKFKTISPKSETQQVRLSAVTAGIRGAETTSTLLEPYWKGDKTSNQQFMQQLESFALAQGMADKGELDAANQAFAAFIEKYPDSDLVPNAEFAQAITYGAMGQGQDSSKLFTRFISAYPEHPLVADAKALLAEL